MTDNVDSPKCPWCSADTGPADATCPRCGARLVETVAATEGNVPLIPGLTAIDPSLAAARARREQPQPKRGLFAFRSGNAAAPVAPVWQPGQIGQPAPAWPSPGVQPPSGWPAAVPQPPIVPASVVPPPGIAEPPALAAAPDAVTGLAGIAPQPGVAPQAGVAAPADVVAPAAPAPSAWPSPATTAPAPSAWPSTPMPAAPNPTPARALDPAAVDRPFDLSAVDRAAILPPSLEVKRQMLLIALEAERAAMGAVAPVPEPAAPNADAVAIGSDAEPIGIADAPSIGDAPQPPAPTDAAYGEHPLPESAPQPDATATTADPATPTDAAE